MHFLPLPNQGVTAKSPLLTFHADGNVRVWNTQTGNLMYEFNTQIVAEESLCTASVCTDGTKMCIGGSDGHIRLMKIDHARFVDPADEQDFTGVFAALRSWRGHINVITRWDIFCHNIAQMGNILYYLYSYQSIMNQQHCHRR